MGLVLSKQSGAVGYLTLGRQSYDSNAQSFIIAAGITNLTQQIATNDLVTDLKGYNIWTKMKAIYPMVGGTATSHKFNLVDARDLDAAFRLNFVGGWTHSSTGALPNGTTAYANTFLTPSATLSSINSAHMSYYSRTNITAAQIEMGNIATVSGQFYLIFNYVSSRPLAINRNGDGTGVPLLANTTGLLIESRVSGTQQKSFKDGSLAHTANFNVASFSNAPVYLGAVNDVNAGNTVTNYSTKQCAFASIGEGFTDTEAANFYTAVQKFQTTLGRQV